MSPAVSAERWPELSVLPAGPVRGAITRAVVENLLRALPLRLRVSRPGEAQPGEATAPGLASSAAGAGLPELVIHRPGPFYRRIAGAGLVGLGEAYMAGDWDSAELAAVLTVLASRLGRLAPAGALRLRRPVSSRRPGSDDQDIAGSARNNRRHYDLGNDMFALFLDETMTYSCALFEVGPAGRPAAAPEVLADAQRRKIDAVLDLAGVRQAARLLEIGTGWGELAVRAGRRGAEVMSVTNSVEQHKLAQRRVAAAGLADRVRIGLCDYREITGQYDAVVSVEMIEAVGAEYWPAYFTAIDHALAPGGKVGLQAITMPHQQMLATSRSHTWIDRYIFPGCLIPSLRSIEGTVANHTGLRIASARSMRPHYAETLRIWGERFAVRADELDALGFDRVFQRMWRFYLAYCEAGFRCGRLDVAQFLLVRPD
jgi:cyclopropane-fatty-acyl-phospholipid synthase